MLTPSLLGCERAPASEICPRIDPGDLVISELRDDQEGNDVVGEYIELHNASGRALDLQGVRIRQIARNGEQHELLIRESLEVAAGGFVVIGPSPKNWVDYALSEDAELASPLIQYGAGFYEVESCDELIDEVEIGVDGLPTMGTLACGDGQTPPDAAANDHAVDLSDAGCWCVDAEPAEPSFQYPGIGLPGTPGSANRCP